MVSSVVEHCLHTAGVTGSNPYHPPNINDIARIARVGTACIRATLCPTESTSGGSESPRQLVITRFRASEEHRRENGTFECVLTLLAPFHRGAATSLRISARFHDGLHAGPCAAAVGGMRLSGSRIDLDVASIHYPPALAEPRGATRMDGSSRVSVQFLRFGSGPHRPRPLVGVPKPNRNRSSHSRWCSSCHKLRRDSTRSKKGSVMKHIRGDRIQQSTGSS